MYDGKILGRGHTGKSATAHGGKRSNRCRACRATERAARCWSQVPEIEHFDVSASEGEFQRCTLTPRDGLDLRPMIFALALRHGWVLRELTRQPPFAGRYLRAGNKAKRRGRILMQIFFDAHAPGTGCVLRFHHRLHHHRSSDIFDRVKLRGADDEPRQRSVADAGDGIVLPDLLFLAHRAAGHSSHHHAIVRAGKNFPARLKH